MPASSPAGVGLARSNLLFEGKLLSSGADLSVTYFSCLFDRFSGAGVLGGNDSFVGFMSDFRQGKVIQSAALPSSVIPSFPISSLQPNSINNGIIAVSNGESAQTSDGGASWTALASVVVAFATTAQDQISWRSSQIFSGNTKQTIPARDYSVSLDNGTSWTGQFFTGATGGASPIKVRKTANDRKLYVVHQSGRLSITTSGDLTAATWVNFDFGALFGAGVNGVDVAFNASGSKAIYITTLGNIIVSIDNGVTWNSFPTATNYFKIGPASFRTLDYVSFVADLEGFILGNSNSAAFISEAGNLQTMTVCNVSSILGLAGIADACSMSDDNDMLVPIFDNALITARPAA